jgi:hypothetical protein
MSTLVPRWVRYRLYYVLALLFMAGSVWPLVSALGEADADRREDNFVGVLILLGLGVVCLLRARKSPEEILDGLPPEKRLRVVMLVFGIAVISATWFTAYDLLRLESHEVERVRVWAPVALVYDLFGFWPSVLLFPFFGVLGIAAIAAGQRALARKTGKTTSE